MALPLWRWRRGANAEAAARGSHRSDALRGWLEAEDAVHVLRASFLDEFQAPFLLPWLKAALNRSCRSDRVTRDPPAALSVGAAQTEAQKRRVLGWTSRRDADRATDVGAEAQRRAEGSDQAPFAAGAAADGAGLQQSAVMTCTTR